jgi:hypothetical protein
MLLGSRHKAIMDDQAGAEMNQWRDETNAWWGGERVRVAFGVAPLAFPASMSIGVALTDTLPGTFLTAVFMFLHSLPYSYVGTLLVGVPVYRFLCARQWTAFWVAPVAGFISGAALSIFIVLLMTVIFSPRLWSSGDDGVAGVTLLPGWILFGGLPGAASGTIVWLIARPDRQQRSV